LLITDLFRHLTGVNCCKNQEGAIPVLAASCPICNRLFDFAM